MTAICPEYLSEGLERVFAHIQATRMRGLPILNPVLDVEAVGMRLWHGHCLGVLITPWFMNLMLLPNEGDDWSDLPPGAARQHVFPSGRYEFIVGEEAGIGRYQMCSLFSPVFEFADQAAAVATAEAVMEALMSPGSRDTTGRAGGEADRATPPVGDRLDTPVSRRALLRAVFPGGAER